LNPPDQDLEFEKLLAFLKHARGFDFTAYKRATLQRRVQKRMALVGAPDYESYTAYLDVHPEEFQHLFNTILINVTAFFRDEEPWEFMRTDLIPKLLTMKGSDPVRVWVAGCASGEEAYTIAIVLAEVLGRDAFREQVKIYATDLDSEALTQSRQATYTRKDLEGIPAALVESYFTEVGERLEFDRELRRSVIFGRHDLIQDAPISRVDLLLCRNTLMYFNSDIQERILSRFHFALNEGGFLFLGKAETLLSHMSLFHPIDLKHRVFSKARASRLRDRSFFLNSPALETLTVSTNASSRLHEAVFEASTLAQIVVDIANRLTLANDRARALFGLSVADIGRPFQDLEISYRPVELRSSIDQALAQRRSITHKDIGLTPPGSEPIKIEVRVAPLFGELGDPVGTSISFEDVTTFSRLRDDLLNFNQELETAYEEVQSTNEELQTTNEELQSTVEELETTNEELQSTNEELETTNEELQSTNEELETINGELQRRTDELIQANFLLESILSSVPNGVVVVDPELVVLSWNIHAEDMWGLRSDEVVGMHLLNLDIGLPLDQLRAPIKACLADGTVRTVTLSATNRRGKPVSCEIHFSPLRGPSDARAGVMILMEATVTAPVAQP